MNSSKESMFATELNKDLQRLVITYCNSMVENGIEYPGNVIANALGSVLASVGHEMAGPEEIDQFIECVVGRSRDMQRALAGDRVSSITLIKESDPTQITH